MDTANQLHRSALRLLRRMQAADLGLDFVVVTSVTRDDLPDGGARHFAATVRAVAAALPGVASPGILPVGRAATAVARSRGAVAPANGPPPVGLPGL